MPKPGIAGSEPQFWRTLLPGTTAGSGILTKWAPKYEPKLLSNFGMT